MFSYVMQPYMDSNQDRVFCHKLINGVVVMMMMMRSVAEFST
jgi:hypothetical protein